MKYGAFLLLMLLAFSTAFAVQDPPGMVAITSTYSDQVTGSALLFKVLAADENTRLFAITASHVSQGKRLEISGKPLDPKVVRGRLADNLKDLELIELDPTVGTPMATWYPQYGKILFDLKILRPWTGGSDPSSRSSSSAYFVDAETRSKLNSSFVLRGSWSAPGAESFHASSVDSSLILNDDTSQLREYVERIPTTQERYADIKISPGMSGAPLVTPYFTQNGPLYGVQGIATQYLRDFPGAWFSGEENIGELITSYLNGRRGLVDPGVVWKEWHSITYRSIHGYDETLPNLAAAGNHRSGDGGAPSGQSGRWDPDRMARTGLFPGMQSSARPGQPIIAFRLPNIGNALAIPKIFSFFSSSLLSKDNEVPLKTDFRK